MTPDPTLLESPVGVAPPATEPISAPAAPQDAATTTGPQGPGGDQVQGDHEITEQDNGSLPLLLAFVGVMIAFGFARSWWIPGIIAGLLFMLFMHELGHYLTARASGMKVTEFFLGFGPKIWSFNRGETEYGIKAIPAGAYVRIIGMTNLEEIDPAEEERTYRAQPYWQRMMTICAGSAMHFLMALACGAVLFGAYQYQGFNGAPWVVDLVVPGSSADDIGVEVGDSVVTFDGQDFATWEEFGEVVSSTPLGPIDVVVERDGEPLTLSGELGPRSQDVILDGFGLIMIEEDATLGWEVSHLYAGDHAEAFGFEVGDIIERAGTVERPSQFTLAAALVEAEGSNLVVDVLRRGEVVTLEGPIDLNESPPFRGFLGIGPVSMLIDDPGAAKSVGLAVDDFGVVTKTNVRGIADLLNPTTWGGADDDQIQRRASALPTRTAPTPFPVVENDAEPSNRPISIIGIGRLIAESESVDQVLFLFMMVNIFIGLFNLMPLLPLDGGHAAIATYERVRGLVTRTPHRVDATKLVPLTWVIVMLLVTVGLWTAFLDIFSWPA